MTFIYSPPLVLASRIYEALLFSCPGICPYTCIHIQPCIHVYMYGQAFSLPRLGYGFQNIADAMHGISGTL